jgi:ribosomal-protein-alanine N-acetyltransferase
VATKHPSTDLPPLCLRKPRHSDLEAVTAIAGDPRTSRYVPTGPLVDPAACQRLLERWVRDWSTTGIGYWLIEHREAGTIIGWGGVRFIEAGGVRVLNMAYRVAFAHWGQGIATHAATRALATAGQKHPGIAVVARTSPENLASERTALKAGLHHVGTDQYGWHVLADRPIDAAILNALPPP